MVKKLIIYIIKRYNLHKAILEFQNEEAIRICNSNVTNNGGTFLPSSIVDNQQNDPKKIAIGKGTTIAGVLLIFRYGGQITIGDNCYIGDNSRIWSGENVSIGNNVLISHNVNIIDTSAHELDSEERSRRFTDLVENGPWNEKGNVVTSPIIIEEFAWVSFNATILKGVRIGKGAIVGASSVVTKDVPPFSLVVGNPARVVKSLK